VLGPETPTPIVETLASQPEVFRAVSRAERVAMTEKLFKELNDSMARLLGHGTGSFFCECGNPLCNFTLELEPDDLLALHSQHGYFAVYPGHEIPDLETVVLSHPAYSVVRNSYRAAQPNSG
jgi:hypothetical protein